MADARAGVETSPQPGPLRVHAVLWNALGRGSIAYALGELLDSMPPDRVERHLWCLRRHPDRLGRREYHRAVFPDLVYRALCKANVSAANQGRIGNPIVLKTIKPGDIVYVWPDFDLHLIKRAQDRGAIVVAERTNVMGPMGKAALTRAFERRGEPLPAGWFTAEVMERERQQMAQCDYVIARNSFVSQSLHQAGIPRDRIIEGSYGYNPDRLRSALLSEKPKGPPVFAFVGAGIVGKGFDALLEAWAIANVQGTLLIAGEIDHNLGGTYREILGRSDVRVLGFVDDIASVYAAADVFIFPSHAEGGPQVVYEAAACGLPLIISPMGAGRLVRHELEGLLIDPLTVDDLVDAIRRLADDEQLRQRLGGAAAERAAAKFTWQNVGRQLYEQFNLISGNRGSPFSTINVSA